MVTRAIGIVLRHEWVAKWLCKKFECSASCCRPQLIILVPCNKEPPSSCDLPYLIRQPATGQCWGLRVFGTSWVKWLKIKRLV
ncbi:MAG: hypothetical protein CMM07_25405 [Rhodopirellula sp.]|nr:hypothetical protein [Rhodopirellula sp.]